MENREKKLFVYAGEHSKGQYIYFECFLSSEKGVSYELEKEKYRQYNKNLFKYKNIGSIFEVETDGKSIFYMKNSKPCGFLLHEKYREDIIKWKTLDFATNDLKKKSNFSLEKYYSNLDPLKEAYKISLGSEKNAILLKIINYITK
ncbi:MAG TPA: hypothetical protein PKC87_00295 [Candidatus Absconditabacterales bacterium]|nr:hypothetical protein [Candidatus Absconditabacterales bacterium]